MDRPGDLLVQDTEGASALDSDTGAKVGDMAVTMRQPPNAVLDLFCGAGGAAMGLHRAWPNAWIVGVDIKPQPHYPFEFVQADAMTFDLEGWDFIWASPVCKRYSQCTPPQYRKNHPDQIGPIRIRLKQSGCPYVIENVPSAARRLIAPVKLCGSMFDLGIKRHRFFEATFNVEQPMCRSHYRPVLITGTHRRTYEPRFEYNVQECRDASGIEWMTRKELDGAIPPAYSEYIGRQYLRSLQ